MGLVRFVTTTGPGYNGITSKDKDTLYFISDERRIYKGEVPYSGGIFTTVAEFPETGEVNTLYVNSATGEVRYYNGTSYQTVVPATGKSITGNGDGSLATTAAVAAYVTSHSGDLNVSALKGRVDTLEGEMNTAQGQITTINGEGDGSIKKAASDAVASAKSYTDTVAAGKANTAHTHKMADVTGLSDALAGKVVYGINVLVDLTSDTVDAAHLSAGYTAHDAAGNLIVGTLAEWEPMKGAIEYDQQTAGVSAYLQATEDYTAINHETVSHASMLAAGGDTCDGYELYVPDGTASVYVACEDGSEGVAHYTPEGGKVTVYNLAPDTIYAYWCISEDGTLKKGGFMRADAGVRLLRMSKLRNCRDIGGWACDGGKVRYGRLFRSADTADASEEDADELKRLGVGSEFDLRSAQEVQAAGGDSKLHTAYSILGFGSWTDTAFSDLTNLNALKAIMESVVRKEGPIVHCQYGLDRTGRIVYILEALLGVSLEDADRDYELSSLYVAHDRTAEMSKDSKFASFRRALIPADGETVADKAASLIRDKRIVTYDLINAFRRAMSTGTPRDLVWTHRLTQTLSGCTSSTDATTINDGESISCTLTADSGRRLDTVTVTMGGADVTSTAYSNGTVAINGVTGDVAITATTAEISTSHAVKTTLSHATIDNSATSVDKGGSYTANVTPDTGFATPTITVTMGGNNITSSAVSGTRISIALVTGDVVITATAARLSNLIPISTDASGNAYGTGGIKANTRIGSGGESDAPGIRVIYTDGTREDVACTGFMPIETGKRIHFENCHLWYNTDGKEVWPVYVMLYDANHQRIAPLSTQASYFAGREQLKPTTEAWDGKAIANVAGTTYSGSFRTLTSMLLDPSNTNIGAAARYVRICAYGLTSDARVWLTDD